MTKVFLSPSSQTANPVHGGGNEQLHQLEHAINQDQPGRAKALIRQMVTQLDATDKATRRGEDTR